MSNADQTKAPDKKTVKAVVGVMNEQPVAKFCNLVQISITPVEGEVVLDFIFMNRSKIDPKTNEVRAFHVDRIVMTVNQARSFSKKLEELLAKT